MMNSERIAIESLLAPAGSALLDKLARRILEGAVIIYPTETIYGIGGGYGIPGVAEKIRAIKGRPPSLPMIVIGPHRSAFDALDLFWSPAAVRLADRFWPGHLTMVLPLRGGGDLAIRASSHPLIAALWSSGVPLLYSTSANRSGAPYDGDPAAIFNQFRAEVGYIIDAGALPPSPPSTVVKISGNDTVTLIREGALSAGDLA